MAPKKSKRQASEKEAMIADGWKKSKLSESKISSLVSRSLLQPRAVIQWQPAEGHTRPFERVAETVLFKAFVERGLAIPVYDFLRGLLFHWGIQLHHLTPDSILHITIFVHLCEAFLGIILTLTFLRVSFSWVHIQISKILPGWGCQSPTSSRNVREIYSIYSALADWWLESRVVLYW